MFDLMKTTGVAAVMALAPLAASAATVSIMDGGSYTIDTADIYTYEELLTGSGGFAERRFTFKANPADAPLPVNGVNLTLTGVGSIDDPVMYWEYGMTTINGTVTSVPGGVSIVANTVFTAPSALEQDLVVAWQGYTGPVQVSVQVDPSPVPVPAAGLLLLSALGGAVALRRKS